jgi:hypothetical protein
LGQEVPPDVPVAGRGTLFAIITAGVLIHPAVARAYGSGPRPAEPGLGEPGPADGELGQA